MVSSVEAAIARGELVWVPLERLLPNNWNPNRMDDFMYAKERESIQRFGIASPMVARLHPDQKDAYQIIDGEHRLKVLDELGHTEAPVWSLGEVPDAMAKQLTIVLNETKGSPEKERLSELLKDLLSSETTESLQSVLPFSKEAFDNLIGVPDFDWSSFEDQTPQHSPDSWVERIYRLPIEAAKVLDQAIAQAKEDEDTPDGIALERIAADFLAG